MGSFDYDVDFISDGSAIPISTPLQQLQEMDALSIGSRKKGVSVLPLIIGLTAAGVLLIYLYQKYNEKPNADSTIYQLEKND